jgi:hypothetical protein
VIARTEWEVRVDSAITDLAAGANTFGLYGAGHPNAEIYVTRLKEHLEHLLEEEPSVPMVLLGEELFIQGRPFARISRSAAALMRRLRRRGVEHVTFNRGVSEDDLRPFLAELAAADDSPVISRPAIQVGKVKLADDELGGPDDDSAGSGRGKLKTFRDRVTLLHETFTAFAGGIGLAVGELDRVSRALLACLDDDPNPIHHFAPWEGGTRWEAVHANNVCVLAQAMARAGGVGNAACTELGVAALVHDIARLFLPEEIRGRDHELAGEDLELVMDHPRDGLGMALAIGALPPIALITIVEHHLAFNGGGYPRFPHPRRPHAASRLIAAADAFVILQTARGGRGLATRESTRAWLDDHTGTLLDPNCCAVLKEVALGWAIPETTTLPGSSPRSS